MKQFRFFLELLGGIFIATMAHEGYHALGGSIQEVGIRFGKSGGFFVDGPHNFGEIGAYIITAIVLIICWIVTFYYYDY